MTEKCPICHGHKSISDAESVTIYIEKGMENGEKIVFEGESDQDPETTAGDLVFHLKLLKHDRFVRKGMDLHMDQLIDLKQGLLGFNLTILHMDKSEVLLSRKGVTQNGLNVNRVCFKGTREGNAQT